MNEISDSNEPNDINGINENNEPNDSENRWNQNFITFNLWSLSATK